MVAAPRDYVEDADIYGNKVDSPDYRPWNDPDYGFKYRPMHPLTRALTATAYAVVVMLACCGAWALIWL